VAHGAGDLRNAVGRGGAFFGITRILRLLRESEVACLPGRNLAKYLVELGSKVLQMFRTLLDAL
jgi:hypothetical protein